MEDQDIIQGAFRRSGEMLKKSAGMILEEVQKSARMLLEVAQKDRTMFACGNGGSAAEAAHLTGEWLCRYKEDRRPLRAVSLVSELATVTAIGNDYNFSDIFARQLQALGSRGDVLVAFTTSGKSANVLSALEVAKRKELKSIVLTGENGVYLRDRADVVIAVPSVETARIQEIHELILHAWCEFVDANLNK